MKYTVGSGIIGAILFICAVGWLVEGNNFLLFKFFAPREEAVRRQTFEESKAYNDGMAQELSAMELDYVKAAPIKIRRFVRSSSIARRATTRAVYRSTFSSSSRRFSATRSRCGREGAQVRGARSHSRDCSVGMYGR